MWTLSRRAPRHRISIAATASPLLGGDMAVCRTLDVSEVGMCLDTAAWFPLGTRLSLSLIDPASGSALEVIGDVVREAQAPSWTLGILIIEPPIEWRGLVASAARSSGQIEKPGRRMRVLVVGDDQRQRGAMALYVTSGWDVLFASDDDSLDDAIHHIELDAVIAELDANDHGSRRSWRTSRKPSRRRAGSCVVADRERATSSIATSHEMPVSTRSSTP
jgi:hypothetical protein